MLGSLRTASRVICKLPGGQKLMGGIMRRKFDKLARTEHGTIRFIEENVEDHIDAQTDSVAGASVPVPDFHPLMAEKNLKKNRSWVLTFFDH